MNKKNKDTLDLLSYRLREREPKLPDALKKEAIVDLISVKEQQSVDSSVIPVDFRSARQNTVSAVRRWSAAAAALVILFATVSVVSQRRGLSPFGDENYSTIPSDNDGSGQGGTAKVRVEAAASYDEIEAVFTKMRENNTALYSKNEGFDNLVGDSAAAPSAEASSDDHGETNTQVEGVDEADIIKNDGSYLYKAFAGKIDIVSLLSAAPEQTALVETDMMYINEIYVLDDLLIALGSDGYSLGYYGDVMLYDRAWGNYDAVTRVEFYDISDRAEPVKVKTLTQDGSYLSSRLVDGELYVLTNDYVNLLDDELICVPYLGDGSNNEPISPGDICILDVPDSPTYLVVCGIDTSDLNGGEVSTKAILGGGHEAYCTADSLFVSREVYKYALATATDDLEYDYYTEIYRFGIDGGKVSYEASGRVEGAILNQFSMDEYNGYFRIATTHGWGSEAFSTVSVLDGELNLVGKVTDIAKGEKIYAVRFSESTAYVVTFEQTDPLFVIDLSTPENPQILGELKIPGFSNYLHPVGENLLLGIGANGNERGQTDGVKLSLFDVSDPHSPREIDTFVIEGAVWSQAQSNHKAVLWNEGKRTIGIPISDYDYGTLHTESYYTFQIEGAGDAAKLAQPVIFNVSYALNDENAYLSTEIVRGTYVGETLYTVSDLFVHAFNLESGERLGDLRLESSLESVSVIDDNGVVEEAEE